MPPKKPLPKSQRGAKVVSSKAAKAEKPADGAAAAEGGASGNHFDASAGGNVVAWLAKKTAATAQPQGALEFLNQQGSKKQGKQGKQQPQQQQQQPAIPAPASKQQQQQPAIPAPASKQQQQQQPAIPVPASKQQQQQQQPQQGNDKKQRQRGGKKDDRKPPSTPPTGPAPSAQPASSSGQEQQLQQQHADPNAPPADPEQQRQFLLAQATHNAIQTAIMQQDSQPGRVPSLDLPSLLEAIDDHQVTIVCTDTGTGKSSALPNALLDADINNRIVSSQPRRTATMAIAQHVAGMRGERVGDTVGYWIRGAKAGDEGTRLWYMTSYTLLLQVLAHPELPYTHVILDEFHERQPDLEVTMALLRLALKKNPKFKVILVSATMDVADWQGYLDGFDVALFHQSETEHRVHCFGLEHICPVIGMAPPRPAQLQFAETSIVDNTVFVAQYLLAYLNQMCAPHHAALVFLPGRAHVEQFTMWIEAQMHMRMTAIPWHSGVELSTIQAAIKRPAGYKQKVYVATDIAEVSITIPDLVFVIDLCLVKRPQINVMQEASVMFPPLSTQYVSQSNISQRKGRVGRTQQGFYFSLLPTDMLAQLPEHSPAPIVNSRIDELALHVLQVVQNPVALFGLCCSQPTIQAVQTSMRTLTDAGLIVDVRDDDEALTSKWNEPILGEATASLQEGVKIDRYRATFVGKLAQVLPVSVSQSLLVFYGFLTGLESLMVLAGACANLPLPFVVQQPATNPMQQQGGRRGRGRNNHQNFARDAAQSIGRAMELAELSMKEHSHDSESDIIAAMGVVLAFRVEARTGATDHQLNEWCVRNQVSRERVQAIMDLEDHIKFELGSFVPFRDVDEPEVQQKQLTRLPNVVRGMISTAFASQALEVTAEGSMRFKIKEGAHGIFTDLAAAPDLHTPSSIRWEVGTVVVPVTLSLRHSHLLGSYTTVVKDTKTFYLSCLLFAHRLHYEIFEDDDGQYYEFVLNFHGRTRAIEANEATGKAIIQFREHLTAICSGLAHVHSSFQADKTPDEAEVNKMNAMQKGVVGALEGFFFGKKGEELVFTEIQQGDEVVERLSALTR